MSALLGPHRSPVGQTQTWITPRRIIDALGGHGQFDLDPCCPAEGMPWPTAREMWRCGERDGLVEPWRPGALVWLNPPYDRRSIGCWLAKLAEHPGGGVALVFARTDTEWAHRIVFPNASAVLFLCGRIAFCDVTGTPAPAPAGAPSMFAAFGDYAASRLFNAVQRGSLSGALLSHALLSE